MLRVLIGESSDMAGVRLQHGTGFLSGDRDDVGGDAVDHVVLLLS